MGAGVGTGVGTGAGAGAGAAGRLACKNLAESCVVSTL